MTTPNQPPTVPVPEPMDASFIAEETPSTVESNTTPASVKETEDHTGQAFLKETPFTPFPESVQKDDPKMEMVFFPGATFQELQDFYREAQKRKHRVFTLADAQYIDIVSMGQRAGHNADYDDAMNRSDGNWVSRIPTENGDIRVASPKAVEYQSRILTGDSAVARVRRQVGLGVALAVPLIHTGVWVVLNSSPKETLINLHYQIVAEKIRMGRRSMGLVFSNESIYRTGPLMSLILDNIDDTSLEAGVDLRDVLSHHDIPLLVAALAHLAYPKGFEYARAYHSPDPSERKIVRGQSDISKMFIFDTSRLTSSQIVHMSRRFTRNVTKKDIDDYKAQFSIRKNRIELMPDTLWMTLKVPTLVESLNAGQAWVDNIDQLVRKTLSTDASDAHRNRVIGTHASSTTMRQYTQWVASIEDDTHIYEDQETIANILSEISDVAAIRENYMKAVLKFINDTTVAIIASPTVDEKEAAYGKADYPRWSRMIPINPEQVFFQLLAQRVEMLEAMSEMVDQMWS